MTTFAKRKTHLLPVELPNSSGKFYRLSETFVAPGSITFFLTPLQANSSLLACQDMRKNPSVYVVIHKLPIQVLWMVLILVIGTCRVVSGQVELCSDNPPCMHDHGKTTEQHGEHDCPSGHVCSCGHSLVIDAPSDNGEFSVFQESTVVYWDLAASCYEEPYRKIDYPPQQA